MHRLAAVAVIGSLAFAVSSASAAILTTSAIADLQVTQTRTNDTGALTLAGNGTGNQINTRWNPNTTAGGTSQNELIVLKFDLTGLNLTSATSASLNLNVLSAQSSARTLGLDAFSTAANLDGSWSESNTYANLPGLTAPNTWGDSRDASVMHNGLNGLGTFAQPSGQTVGSNYVLNSAQLLALAQAPGADNVITLIVNRYPSNASSGQSRFSTRENALLDPTRPAAFLAFTVPDVPEPASLSILAAVGAMVLRRR